jgi:hypothetical protein
MDGKTLNASILVFMGLAALCLLVLCTSLWGSGLRLPEFNLVCVPAGSGVDVCSLEAGR